MEILFFDRNKLDEKKYVRTRWRYFSLLPENYARHITTKSALEKSDILCYFTGPFPGINTLNKRAVLGDKKKHPGHIKGYFQK